MSWNYNRHARNEMVVQGSMSVELGIYQTLGFGPRASDLRLQAGFPGHVLFLLTLPYRLVYPDQGVGCQGLEARPETAC